MPKLNCALQTPKVIEPIQRDQESESSPDDINHGDLIALEESVLRQTTEIMPSQKRVKNYPDKIDRKDHAVPVEPQHLNNIKLITNLDINSSKNRLLAEEQLLLLKSSGPPVNQRITEIPTKSQNDNPSHEIAPKLPAKKIYEPHYAKPVSPPRPVTPPRPRSPAPSSQFEDCSPAPPPRPVSPKSRSLPKKSAQHQPLSRTSVSYQQHIESNNNRNCSNKHVQNRSSASYPEVDEWLSTRPSASSRRSSPARPYTPQSQYYRPHTPSQYSPVTARYTPRETTPSSLVYSNPVQRRNSYLERSDSRLSDFDSDYPPFEMSREYARTPLLFSDSNLSRMGSTSLISESNYSAITPEVSRKLCLSAQTEPKFSKDFGFVSSKKESVPKPPRRTRSKDVPSRPGKFI